eukprot:1157358-Pelagomonas_calceolata.AAC.7
MVGMVRFEKENWERAYPGYRGFVHLRNASFCLDFCLSCPSIFCCQPRPPLICCIQQRAKQGTRIARPEHQAQICGCAPPGPSGRAHGALYYRFIVSRGDVRVNFERLA